MAGTETLDLAIETGFGSIVDFLEFLEATFCEALDLAASETIFYSLLAGSAPAVSTGTIFSSGPSAGS